MDKRPRFLSVVAVIATLIAFSSVVGAGEVGQVNAPPIQPRNPVIVSEAASEDTCELGEPYGVPVSPAVYLVNFLLLYIANPNEAANMPAYRTTIPLALSDCLKEHPEGCPYAEFAHLLDGHACDGGANRNKRCFWPTECQTDPKWERLAPSVAGHPDQINEPLGTRRAKSLARLLGIDEAMILTDAEYQCTIGTPPRNQEQETIFSCITNLTNSNGNTDIPLSSYGLAITDQGDVQSLCAPEAPCLVFNNLFEGPLERIALECGWGVKLERMVRETPFFQLVDDGNKCQQFGGAPTGACVVEPICPSVRPYHKSGRVEKTRGQVWTCALLQ